MLLKGVFILATSFIYNDENLEDVKASLQEEETAEDTQFQEYTMVPVNSPCKVTLKQKSYDICAKSILK